MVLRAGLFLSMLATLFSLLSAKTELGLSCLREWWMAAAPARYRRDEYPLYKRTQQRVGLLNRGGDSSPFRLYIEMFF